MKLHPAGASSDDTTLPNPSTYSAGLTPEERSRLWWDISWIWGPPEDHLAHLFQTLGSDRFVYGTHWPMRLTQNPRANLELLPEDLRDHHLADASALIAR